jgi:hypothetical protein
VSQNTHPEGIDLQRDQVMVDREDLGRLWEGLNDLAANERFLLQRWIEGVPMANAIYFGTGQALEQTLIGPGADERFQGVAVFNYGGSTINIGFAAGAASGVPLYRCPPETLLVLPINFQDVSLAVNSAAAAGAQFPVTVARLRVAPLGPQAFPLSGGIEQGGLADSVLAAGATAAAPASGTTVATIPAAQLPAGVYSVQVTSYETGTIDANPVNMTLRRGATPIGPLASTAVVTQVTRERVTLDGSSALTVVVGAAAGGAGSVYVASLAATQIA